MSKDVMSKSNSCNEQLDISGLVTRMPESLTEIQWNVIERRLIYGDTFEDIGGRLGVANARVQHIQSKAVDELIKVFHKEIKCFSIRLEKILSEAGGTLTAEQCFAEFPEINEAEFNILFAVCQKNREGILYREKELVLVKDR